MANKDTETENERFQRILRELYAIRDNPEETWERRQKADKAISDLTQGSHYSASFKEKREPRGR